MNDLSFKPEPLRDALMAGAFPDAKGRYGPFGGRYVPETLTPAIARLEEGFNALRQAPDFVAEVKEELDSWAGRPTALTHARRLGEAWGADVWLKREDLTHTGAHKINNAVGQVKLAQRMGIRRIIAETGAGQHGVATAAACARAGLPCTVYMGAVDVERQAPNVDRIRRLGAELIPVTSGDKTLRAAVNEAMRAWAADPMETHYVIGSAVGPHPFPYIVRHFQSVIGKEARQQILETEGRLPDAVIACVGGGSNAIGLFHPFIRDAETALLGIEAGGRSETENSAPLSKGTPGVLHGAFSMLIQDENGQVADTHSIAAGLDYPGVGPEHALLQLSGRARYETVRDEEALDALNECCALEGILPAIESSHALAGARRYAQAHPGSTLLVGLSGRGDKDLPTLLKLAEKS
ncbi:tryptophan synthase subunit beta [Hyphobacterium sp. HN65]|uniref:Tryptophan synthase beta chain n=1 Tax=Hyphobacterium lacteum TaxID=3116575 RepID=A0ABU7LSB9_9PROT|nr:tryptophan synthase subunit beta [Hyphobacterium sp. HN65]MEE2526817.1 tryptophan synthase subunit beta [Hyphobacterium sp. HN65]